MTILNHKTKTMTSTLSAESIHAVKFIPKNRKDQWDIPPSILLSVPANQDLHSDIQTDHHPNSLADSSISTTTNASPSLLAWIHDPVLKRNPYDLSLANVLEYSHTSLSDTLNFIRQFQTKVVMFQQLAPSHRQYLVDVSHRQIQNIQMVSNLRQAILQFENIHQSNNNNDVHHSHDNYDYKLSHIVKSPAFCNYDLFHILNELRQNTPLMNYIISSNAEAVAQQCDRVHNYLHKKHNIINGTNSTNQSALHMIQQEQFAFEDLFELQRSLDNICHAYVTRLSLLLHIERLRTIQDITAHDLYSIKFDYIQIAQPSIPHPKCFICNGGTYASAVTPIREQWVKKLCAYHLAIQYRNIDNDAISKMRQPMNSNQSRQIHTYKTPPSQISTSTQFLHIQEILNRMRNMGDKIIARITIPGVAENRPLVSIGDALRFRFDSNNHSRQHLQHATLNNRNNTTIEVVGEVIDVNIKSESVLVYLPPCILSNNNQYSITSYIDALSYPNNIKDMVHENENSNYNNSSNLDQLGRFDLRFGLFGGRGFEIFQRVIQEAKRQLPIQSSLHRVIAPTQFLKGIKRRNLGIESNYISQGLDIDWIQPLNGEQKQAVIDVINQHHGKAPYLIFGPPGTGKTLTVVESILQVLRNNPQAKILVCAPSDAACDVLAKRLLQYVDDVHKNTNEVDSPTLIRVNYWSRNPASLPPELLSYSPTNSSGFFTFPSLDKLRSASIIVCQCFVVGCLDLEEMTHKVEPGPNENQNFDRQQWIRKHFTHCFVDESSQSLECEALVPLLKVGEDCSIILAGDPKQLSPHVRDEVTSRMGLSLSLQERLMSLPLYKRKIKKPLFHRLPPYTNTIIEYDDGDEEFCVMTTLLGNYRSHAALLCIPSLLFYHNTLQSLASSEVTSSCKNFELLTNGDKFPMLIYDVSSGKELNKLDTPSYFNVQECHAVVKLIQALLMSSNVSVHIGEIAVITCFRAQVLKLREILRKNNLGGINVGCVEDFQGQEKSVILISTVLTKNIEHHRSDYSASSKDGKSQSMSSLGFMNDPKRFNVAITRAGALCMVVGHVDFLESSNTYWSALVDHVRRNNGLSGDSESKYNTNQDCDYEEYDDYGIEFLVKRVEELHSCLGSGYEEDRYDLAQRGFFQDAPEWKVILT